MIVVAGWQVDPAGVQKIIDAVSATGLALGKDLGGLGDDLQTVVSGTGSGEVGSALQAFTDVMSGHVSVLDNQVPLVLDALSGAANAVLAGDESMAVSIEAVAVAEVDGVPASVFARGGRGAV